jgi:hypothetical protein
MAFVEEAHINDIGTIFRVTVYDTTSTGTTEIADISAATSLTFTFKRPDGTTYTKNASFTNTGTDGQIQYVTVDGDLNVAGTWSIQAYVVTPTGSHKTNTGTFRVFENL